MIQTFSPPHLHKATRGFMLQVGGTITEPVVAVLRKGSRGGYVKQFEKTTDLREATILSGYDWLVWNPQIAQVALLPVEFYAITSYTIHVTVNEEDLKWLGRES